MGCNSIELHPIFAFKSVFIVQMDTIAGLVYFFNTDDLFTS